MDEFRQVQSELSKPGSAGWWERLDLPEEKIRQLHEAAADSSISHRAISVVLGRWGVKVNPQQVGHWRRSVVGMAQR